jgi:hypothetical protein
MVLPPEVRTLFAVVISLSALAGFVALFGSAIWETWRADQKPQHSENYLYLATALAGLVGGIVATGFGQRPPELPPASPGSVDNVSRAGVIFFDNIVDLGYFVTAGMQLARPEILGSIYAGLYILLGLASIVTWVKKQSVASDLVRNLASVTIGLFLPIVSSFFGQPN